MKGVEAGQWMATINASMRTTSLSSGPRRQTTPKNTVAKDDTADEARRERGRIAVSVAGSRVDELCKSYIAWVLRRRVNRLEVRTESVESKVIKHAY